MSEATENKAKSQVTSKATSESKRSGMLITVVITNCNYGRFVGTAIESVLGQTYPNVECVVVDDGSTDGSREVIARYQGITALFKANGGQAQALKAGAQLARGEVIITLDADDYLLPQACARIAEHWEAGVSCLNYRLAVEGQSFASWPTEKFLDSGHAEFLLKHGYYPSPPMSGNAFDTNYVRQFLARGRHLDGDGVDAYLLYSAPFFGRVAHIDEPLAFYRMHCANVSMTSGRKTVRNLGDHAYYQYWAQQNAYAFAREQGRKIPARTLLKGAYPAMWMLIAKDGGYTRRKLPEQGTMETAWVALQAFLIQPGIPFASRIKNAAFLLAVLVMPKTLRLALANRLVSKQ